jgi:hypothetical protein
MLRSPDFQDESMDYKINPMPEMVSQKLWIGVKTGLPLIDPTCGRYCLKALLKYHIEVHCKVRVPDISLPRRWSYTTWVGYDPYDDFSLAKDMLRESDDKPKDAAAWIERLKLFGPAILSGYLGNAHVVSHYILLVGASSDGAGKFYYKDPLVGDDVKEESFASMQPKIELPIVVAKGTIGAELAKHPELAPELQKGLPK